MSLGSIYKATCTRCQQTDTEHIYIGETARTLYIRKKEHQRAYKKAAKDSVVPDDDEPGGSWMWDHVFHKHGAPELTNIDPSRDFTFENVSYHRDPMARQVEEALRIFQSREKVSYTSRSNKDLKVNSLYRRDEHFAPQQRMTFAK